MYIDSQTQFSDDQALTAAGTTVSTNVYDTGAAADIGVGQAVMFFATVTSALLGGTSVQAKLQTSADNVTFTDLGAGPVVPVAELVAGKKIAAFSVPHGAKRYLRAAYVVAGTFTGGTVHSSLTLDVDAGNRGTVTSGIPRI